MDMSWLRRDVAVGHPDFGKAVKCPDCAGNAIRGPHDEGAVARALIEREITTTNAIRAAHGHGPLDNDEDTVPEPERADIAESVRAVAAGMRRIA